MGPAYYVLAVFGCADGGHACEPVATVTERYATRDACLAGSVGVLYDQNADFPELVARCEPAGSPQSGDRAPLRRLRDPAAG